MIDDKAAEIFEKLANRNLFGNDLESFLDVFKYYTNKSEYAEDELYGWERIVQVNLRDSENFYIKTEDPFAEHPKLAIKYGNADSPDTVITADRDSLTGIISGRLYSFMVKERFKIEGDNTQAVIFFMLLRLIEQELTEKENKRKLGKNF